MRPSVRPLAALAVAAAVVLGGCAASDESDTAAEPSASTPAPQQTPSGSAGTPTGSESTSPGSDDDVVEIEIEIEDGEVEPAGKRVDVQVGQTIRLVVDSDTADEIHVHSTPEHAFAVNAGADDQEFEFTLQQPGVVEAELHDLGDVVLTFAARP